LTKCGGDKQKAKLALAFMFAHTGTPCIYYGTEVGIDGGGDPLCRKCMVWEEDKQDHDMLTFMKKLIRFRKDYQSTLTYGDLLWLKNENDKQVICFLRKDKNHRLLFAFNRSAAEQSIPWGDLNVENSNAVKNIWENKPIQEDILVLGPKQFTVLEIAN
jgi:glycosidase